MRDLGSGFKVRVGIIMLGLGFRVAIGLALKFRVGLHLGLRLMVRRMIWAEPN